jgi:hypothetical protein
MNGFLLEKTRKMVTAPEVVVLNLVAHSAVYQTLLAQLDMVLEKKLLA